MKLIEDRPIATPWGFTYQIERSPSERTFDYMLVLTRPSLHKDAGAVAQIVTVDIKTHRDARDCIIAFSWDDEYVSKMINTIGGWPHREHRDRALRAAKSIGIDGDSTWVILQAGVLLVQDRAVFARSQDFH